MEVIDRQQLENMNNHHRDDFVLINVLEPEAFNKAHIRTSINIPQSAEDFESEVERVAGSKDREVVVYCANRQCDASTKAAEKLDRAGFRQVFEYAGGTEDWQQHHQH